MDYGKCVLPVPVLNAPQTIFSTDGAIKRVNRIYHFLNGWWLFMSFLLSGHIFCCGNAHWTELKPLSLQYTQLNNISEWHILTSGHLWVALEALWAVGVYVSTDNWEYVFLALISDISMNNLSRPGHLNNLNLFLLY